MPKVAICICTFERPDGLRNVLNALDAQRLSILSSDDLRIIIVDNSASGSAEAVFSEYSRVGRFASTFVHEKNRGLSNARNAAIERALALKVEFFGFIDDDDTPLPDWIENLVTEAVETRTAAVVGPVYPLFSEPPPEWAVASSLFTRVSSSRNGFCADGATAHSLISCAAVNGLNLRFDLRFNETGGEDTWFFKQLRNAGERIAWAEAAIVMEHIPRQRMTRRWLLQRWYRTGATEAALCNRGPSSHRGRFVNLVKGLARIGGGTLLIVQALILRPFRESGSIFASCYTLCRGAGLLMSVIGKEPKEYSAPGYRH
jgi:glycosyltransferase involved in cell wall biosynthesis